MPLADAQMMMQGGAPAAGAMQAAPADGQEMVTIPKALLEMLLGQAQASQQGAAPQMPMAAPGMPMPPMR